MGKIRKATKGEKFGLLVTLGEGEIRREGKHTRRYEKCKCECGNIIFTPYTSLRRGHTQSCGCIRKITTPKKGTRFGRRTTLGEGEIRPIGTQGGRGWFEKCVCDCGNVKLVSYQILKNGSSNSCGCYHGERVRECCGKNFITHGLSKTRIYKIYRGMRARCNNSHTEKYELYGGRGIKCLWKTFEDFYKDMGESYDVHVKEYGEKNTTIDRIDSNGNYCKENCRWATREEQANNTSQNRYVVYKGEKITIATYAKILGITPKKLYKKLNKGEPLDLGLFGI